ncbi:MAG: hypothetical protein WB729_25015 [Candidatus Sulfotelmatobacter sp.]
MICLPQRDDADYIVRAWRECYKGDAALNRANPDPSSFAIVLTGVGTNEKKTAEHFFRLREVDAVLPDIGSILGFVPFKNHCNSNRSYNKILLLPELSSFSVQCWFLPLDAARLMLCERFVILEIDAFALCAMDV